jgi:hypothetical protein
MQQAKKDSCFGSVQPVVKLLQSQRGNAVHFSLA